VEHYTKETERLIKNTELEWRKLQAQEYIDPAKALEAKERGNDFFRAGNWVDAIKEYEVSVVILATLCNELYQFISDVTQL
jgi:stress-induced-phosphoprotein 1